MIRLDADPIILIFGPFCPLLFAVRTSVYVLQKQHFNKLEKGEEANKGDRRLTKRPGKAEKQVKNPQFGGVSW